MAPSNIRIRWNDQIRWIPYYQIKQMSFEDFVKQIKISFKDESLLSYDLCVEEGQCVIHDDESLRQAMDYSQPDIVLVPKPAGRHFIGHHVPVIKPIVLRWTKDESYKRNHWPSNDNRRYLRKDSGVSMDTTNEKERSVSTSPSILAISPFETIPSSTVPSSPIQLAPIQSLPPPPLVSLPPITPRQPNPFLCDQWIAPGRICGQVFRRSYDLTRHQTIHLKNRPLSICHQCGKKFTRLDALRRHERVQGHHPPLKQQTWSSPYPIHSRQARV